MNALITVNDCPVVQFCSIFVQESVYHIDHEIDLQIPAHCISQHLMGAHIYDYGKITAPSLIIKISDIGQKCFSRSEFLKIAVHDIWRNMVRLHGFCSSDRAVQSVLVHEPSNLFQIHYNWWIHMQKTHIDASCSFFYSP